MKEQYEKPRLEKVEGLQTVVADPPPQVVSGREF